MKIISYQTLIFIAIFSFICNTFIPDKGIILGFQLTSLLYLAFAIERLFFLKIKLSFFNLFVWINIVSSFINMVIYRDNTILTALFLLLQIANAIILILNHVDYVNFKEAKKELFK